MVRADDPLLELTRLVVYVYGTTNVWMACGWHLVARRRRLVALKRRA